MTTTISTIKGWEILDSRGRPTIAVEVRLSDGTVGHAAVPSGASTGSHEAVESRDGDQKRYGGLGVLKSVSTINEYLDQAFRGSSPFDQNALDAKLREIDGTVNKSRLGANATLGVSLGAAHASANSLGLPLYSYLGDENASLLPTPMFNVLNGGKHATNSTDIQEFMVVPLGAPTFAEALRAGAEVYQTLYRLLSERGLSTTLGDEGGFAPSSLSNREALKLLHDSIEGAGYQPGREVAIALDVAATELYRNGKYHLPQEGLTLGSQEMIDFLAEIAEEFPVVSIEDGLAEDDWEAWGVLTRRMGNHLQLVGDDLFTTDVGRIARGITDGSANSVLIKPNQIGTLTETLEAVAAAREAGWGFVISHRSGETEDTTIADLAVATGAGQIKAGAPARSERVCKYNRLLYIEEELQGRARYAGRNPYNLTRD